MLTSADTRIPMRMKSQLRVDEVALATLRGLGESGLLLTDRRLFAWRESGTGSPLPLGAVDRILVDDDDRAGTVAIVVIARHSVHPSLVLTCRAADAAEVSDFVRHVAAAARVHAEMVELGPLRRFTFA